MHIGRILLAWLLILIVVVCGLVSSGIFSIEIKIEKKEKEKQKKDSEENKDPKKNK